MRFFKFSVFVCVAVFSAPSMAADPTKSRDLFGPLLIEGLLLIIAAGVAFFLRRRRRGPLKSSRETLREEASIRLSTGQIASIISVGNQRFLSLSGPHGAPPLMPLPELEAQPPTQDANALAPTAASAPAATVSFLSLFRHASRSRAPH